MSEQTRSIVLSRSKIQYAAAANVKKMPIITSNAVTPDLRDRLHELESVSGDCSVVSAEPTSTWCLTPVECLAARAICALPLGLSAWSTWCERARHGERERDGDHARVATR